MSRQRTLLAVATLLAMLAPTTSAPMTATVHGRAQPFALGNVLSGANISCEEFPTLTAVTDSTGRFQLDAPIGANLTLTLQHPKTRTTTAATFTVPPEGIPAGAETEVPFQAPYVSMYDALTLAMRDIAAMDDNMCHFCVTVAGVNKTLDSHPQGEPGTVVTLYDGTTGRPVPTKTQNYFGVMGANATDPFTRGLNSTSWDGGVVWLNVPLAQVGWGVSGLVPKLLLHIPWQPSVPFMAGTVPGCYEGPGLNHYLQRGLGLAVASLLWLAENLTPRIWSVHEIVCLLDSIRRACQQAWLQVHRVVDDMSRGWTLRQRSANAGPACYSVRQ